MQEPLYYKSESQSSIISPNIVTIAQALPAYGKQPRLNKTIYGLGQERPYDNAKYYKFHEREIYTLFELHSLVKKILHQPRYCLLRGVAKDYKPERQLRRANFNKETGEEATIIEIPQNWFALDIDYNKYIKPTDDLERDTYQILSLLGLYNYECFSIASASFARSKMGKKPGINIRIFMWASEPVYCIDLKNHFTGNKAGVDLALFHPIQPIYTARPTFVNQADHVTKQIAWLPGENASVYISTASRNKHGSPEVYRTKKQAEAFRVAGLKKIANTDYGNRHETLVREGYMFGKLIAQELLDEYDTIQDMLITTRMNWGDNRNEKRDLEAFNHGIARGKLAMEETMENTTHG